MGNLDNFFGGCFGCCSNKVLWEDNWDTTHNMLIERYWMSDYVHRLKILGHTSYSGAQVTVFVVSRRNLMCSLH